MPRVRPIVIDLDQAPTRLQRCLPALAIIALTCAVYLPIVHAGFIWDDGKHVFQNQLLHSLDGLWTLWTRRTALPQYYPLTHTFFWIEYHLWGNDPLGFHIDNVLLHATNALLIWRVLRRLGVGGAAVAAILFAIHPVHVETVAWVSERKNTLSTFFYLLSLLCYLRLAPFETPTRFRQNWYAASSFLFACALLSKTVTSTLPAAILLLIWWKNGRVRWTDVRPLVPFFAVGLLAGVNTAWLERTHVGASGPEWRFAATIPCEVVARVLIAGRVVWFYLAKLIVPYPLMFEYPRWHIDVSSGWQYLFPVAAIGLIATLLILRKSIGRGPATALLFFIGTLVPALGVANIYPMRFSFVADHFQYLASIGPIALLCAIMSRSRPTSSLPLPVTRERVGVRVGWQTNRVMSAKSPSPRPSPGLPGEGVAIAVCMIVVLAFSCLTFARAQVFRSEESLYENSIAKNPHGWMTQSNLGALLIADQKLDDAQSHLLTGLRLHPDNPIAALRMAQVASLRGESAASIAWDRSAIAMNPRMAEPHLAMADTFLHAGNTSDALREYGEAVALQPDGSAFRLGYGVALLKAKRFAEAVVQLDAAVQIDPSSDVARINRLVALERSGQYDRAATELHSILATRPNAVMYRDLGIVEAVRNRRPEAIDAYTRALQLNPNLPDTRERLNRLK